MPKIPQVVKQISSFNTNNGLGRSKKVHDTTLRSQNAEQLRENGWLRCRRKPQEQQERQEQQEQQERQEQQASLLRTQQASFYTKQYTLKIIAQS